MHEDVEFTYNTTGVTENNFPPISKEGKNISCKILCLDWGGEFVQNPCQYATGSIIEVVPHNRDGKLSFKVDFGNDLGVQIVLVEECQD